MNRFFLEKGGGLIFTRVIKLVSQLVSPLSRFFVNVVSALLESL